MELDEITIRVLFLIALSFFGYLVGKKLGTNPKEISSLLVYVISPAVIFISILQAPEENRYFSFLVGSYVICCLMSGLALLAGRTIWKDNTEFLFAFSGGTGNTGYFGLPIAIGLFGIEGAAIAVFIILGANLYEFTVGYFLASRGDGTIKESLLKISKLPIIYAFIFALIMRSTDITINETIALGLDSFKGAYSVLGMMVIGITLGKITKFEFDSRYITYSLLWKFIAWPIVGLMTIAIYPGHLEAVEKSVILLMCSVPMAGNVVIISNDLGIHPEKAATAVMISTVLAIFSVPIVMGFL